MTDAVTVFKCLGDKTRLSILAMLREGDSYVELLAEKLALTSGTVCHHLKKLEEAGLVHCARAQYYRIYSLNRAAVERTVADYLEEAEIPADDGGYEQRVLDSFITDGRLHTVPAQLKKREIVFRYILRTLERGRDYTEGEINEVITAYHGDYCFIRREMIALGLMEREREIYRVR